VSQAPVVNARESSNEVSVVQAIAGKPVHRTYKCFDKVFGEYAPQEDVFLIIGQPMAEEVIKGFNGTIFAYGQSGTGKTYTMEGQDWDGPELGAEAGLIPRTVRHIFEALASLPEEHYAVKVSFLEIYNEELVDLLQPGKVRCGTPATVPRKRAAHRPGTPRSSCLPCIRSAHSSPAAPSQPMARVPRHAAHLVVGRHQRSRPLQADLRLQEESGKVVVKGLKEEFIESAGEAMRVLLRGVANRRTAETRLNMASSRSHSIFTISTHVKEATPEGDDLIKIGKLHLVDLAGSENVSRSGARDARAREAGQINQSLLTLGRVINALVDTGMHVPYRCAALLSVPCSSSDARCSLMSANFRSSCSACRMEDRRRVCGQG
jgi:kinesin family member 11